MDNTTNTHWSFWVIAVFAFVWNALGSVNYLMQMNPEMVASLPETHKAIIIGRPAWATGGFAVAVFGGALGGVLLLLRKSVAIYVFIASLLGVLVTMIHTFSVMNSGVAYSGGEIFVMALLPVIIAMLLIWYTRVAGNKGWLR